MALVDPYLLPEDVRYRLLTEHQDQLVTTMSLTAPPKKIAEAYQKIDSLIYVFGNEFFNPSKPTVS